MTNQDLEFVIALITTLGKLPSTVTSLPYASKDRSEHLHFYPMVIIIVFFFVVL